MFKKLLSFIGFLIFLGAVSFVGYGIKTQCPDVAIYVKCSDGK